VDALSMGALVAGDERLKMMGFQFWPPVGVWLSVSSNAIMLYAKKPLAVTIDSKA